MRERWGSIDEFYQELFERVVTEDLGAQQYYLSMVEEQRHIPASWLLEQGIIFIPNNDYISYHMGQEALNPKYGMYLNGIALWNLFVLIPIRDLVGRVVGFVGWDAENKRRQLEGEEGLNMYKVSNKYVFQKDNHFLCIPSQLKDSFKKTRAVFVVDGVFDCLALAYHGLPVVGLLGSSISPVIGHYLRWYDRIFVVKDNDEAGSKMYQRLKSKAPKALTVSQSKTKDIEELLRDNKVSEVVCAELSRAISGSSPYAPVNLDRFI